MKKNITYIDAVKFENIIREKEMPITAQAGFIKVSGAKGRNIYVANTKLVGRVDLSGFKVDMVGVFGLEGAKFGNVEQQMDFTRSEEQILATFSDLVDHLKTLEPVVKESKAKAEAAKKEAAVGWSVAPPSKEEREAARAARKALIEATAKSKGVEVSPNADI